MTNQKDYGDLLKKFTPLCELVIKYPYKAQQHSREADAIYPGKHNADTLWELYRVLENEKNRGSFQLTPDLKSEYELLEKAIGVLERGLYESLFAISVPPESGSVWKQNINEREERERESNRLEWEKSVIHGKKKFDKLYQQYGNSAENIWIDEDIGIYLQHKQRLDEEKALKQKNAKAEKIIYETNIEYVPRWLIEEGYTQNNIMKGVITKSQNNPRYTTYIALLESKEEHPSQDVNSGDEFYGSSLIGGSSKDLNTAKEDLDKLMKDIFNKEKFLQ